MQGISEPKDSNVRKISDSVYYNKIGVRDARNPRRGFPIQIESSRYLVNLICNYSRASTFVKDAEDKARAVRKSIKERVQEMENDKLTNTAGGRIQEEEEKKATEKYL
jgi:hypothetical protein